MVKQSHAVQVGMMSNEHACTVFIAGIDSTLRMHRLAWERAVCAAVVIATHRSRIRARASRGEMGAQRSLAAESDTLVDPFIL